MKNSKKKLRILLVIDSLGSGGAQRQIVWLAIGLSQRGHYVSLFNYNPGLDHFRPELEAQGVEIYDSHKKYRLDFAPAFRLRKLIISKCIDVVISFLDTPNFYAIVATIGIKKTKVLVSERYTFTGKRLNYRTWCIYQSYRLAQAVTVNSLHQRDHILQKFPWCQKKLYTIWNGVDLEKYKPTSDGRPDDGLGIKVLGVGTIVRRKNIFNLIKALHLANERGARVVIDWFGKVSPDEESNSERIRCDSLIREHQLHSCWCWRGERDNMHEIYSQYDALIHPSYSEGLPNAICEALACGMPILASAVGDHPRLVSNGINGWLFDPEDPEEIANALVLVHRSVKERRSMSIESRRIAEEKLGIIRLIDEHEVILREICSG